MILSNDILCEIIKHCFPDDIINVCKAFPHFKEFFLDTKNVIHLYKDSKWIIYARDEMYELEVKRCEEIIKQQKKAREQFYIDYLNKVFEEYLTIDNQFISLGDIYRLHDSTVHVFRLIDDIGKDHLIHIYTRKRPLMLNKSYEHIANDFDKIKKFKKAIGRMMILVYIWDDMYQHYPYRKSKFSIHQKNIYNKMKYYLQQFDKHLDRYVSDEGTIGYYKLSNTFAAWTVIEKIDLK